MGISYCKIERGFAERKLPFSHDFLLDVSIDDALDISCIPEHCRSITYSVKDVGKCFMYASTHFCWIDPFLLDRRKFGERFLVLKCTMDGGYINISSLNCHFEQAS